MLTTMSVLEHQNEVIYADTEKYLALLFKIKMKMRRLNQPHRGEKECQVKLAKTPNGKQNGTSGRKRKEMEWTDNKDKAKEVSSEEKVFEGSKGLRV